jgi:hypothetical protein
MLMHPYTENGFTSLLSHQGAVTKLQATADFNYFFSAGEDGVLYIYKIVVEKIPGPED